MAETTEVLADFKGFAVRYDPGTNPFFKAIMVENLRKIQTVPAGVTLFKLIADAQPKSRDDFPIGVNVMCKPKAVKYVESGYSPMFGKLVANPAQVSPKGCRHTIVGSSLNASRDPTASENGQGSVCDMEFTNAQMITSKGETAYPFVVLAHELIHSYHCLYGIKKADDEEQWASGLGIYATDPLTENVFRSQFNLGPRKEY